MKIMKTMSAVVLAVSALFAFSGRAYADEPLASINVISTGQQIRTNMLKFYVKQGVLGYDLPDSDQQKIVNTNDEYVLTPAGMLFPEKNGSLSINAGDDVNIIKISMSDNILYVSLEAGDEGYLGPLARVRVNKTGNKFDVPYNMWFDLESGIWNFDMEDDSGTRHYGSLDVEISTAAGNLLFYENTLYIFWPEGDRRANRLPMKIVFFDDWYITEGLIGE